MSVFEPITLGWDGAEYIIPANRVMGAVNRAEQHYTLAEIYADRQNRQTVRLGKLAAAYGSVLRYAGAQVSDDDVYEGLFGGADAENAGEIIMAALDTLAEIMTPPSLASKKSQPKPKPKSNSTGGKGSSSKRTKSHAAQSSAADGE